VGLQEYRAKRQFGATPEPAGHIAQGQGPLRFVVQKHHATRLHYDFRIEAGGTLRSWAVPKGPSYHSHEKRLAVMVEDHPLDYLLFEGTIPKGNYGAGTVMVWDTGTYHLPGISNREQCERLVEEGLKDGHLHLVLHGTKLRGEFGLVRMKREDEKSWLFFLKSPDQPVPPDEDKSVLSGRTMDEIARGAEPVARTLDGLAGAPKAPMPRNLKPMLANPADKPFDRPGWMFEVKWDGYRAIAEVEKGQVRLYSRKNLSFGSHFSPIVDSLEHLGHNAVLDGEIVVLDIHGKPQFSLMQTYQRDRKGTLVYEIFDLIYLDGHDLRKLPLAKRIELLAGVLPDLPHVRLGDHLLEHGVAFFNAVSEKGLEGIIAKDSKSPYTSGIRSQAWLKIKAQRRMEAVIAGFTEPSGGRRGLGSLVLGVYDGDELDYIGHAGSGFDDKGLLELRARLDELAQPKCPFKKRPKTNAPANWVRPELVCEISFQEWTADDHLRHPVFLGVREDKDAKEVRRERVEALAAPKEEPQVKAPQIVRPPVKGEQTIDGHVLKLTNLDKVYWPDEGYTKGDLIQYYREVARLMVPHLKDRPQSLNRHPNGIKGKSFFQKDVRKQPPPDWVKTIEIASDDKMALTLLCRDEATLVYLANLGCIEINPWNCRVETIDQPDYALLDLDPESVSFDAVVEAAQMIRKVLENAGVKCYCKTSGKRGLHVYVPFGARYSHDQAKQFAELIGHIVNARLPKTMSLARMPSARQHRVYLDYIQNGKGKTLAAPYSVRPYPGATVSTPLKWAEVTAGLDPGKFTIRTMRKRLDMVGDLWEPVLGKGIDLEHCIKKLALAHERLS
jgi:bifunctional non-homologous end joining protein LigD